MLPSDSSITVESAPPGFANPVQLIEPHGGKLIHLLVSGTERAELIRKAAELPSIQLSARSLCDLELMATGAFSPLDRFMRQRDYLRVIEEMRLADDTFFPLPITLPVADPKMAPLGREIVLRSSRNELIAILSVEEVYEADPAWEAVRILPTDDPRHPLISEMSGWGRYYVSGPMQVLSLPAHYDFPLLRRTPVETRGLLSRFGNTNVIAFLPRGPMSRMHEELTKQTAGEIGATLLIQPAVGLTEPGDADHYTRVRTYMVTADKYCDSRSTLLNLSPLATRAAGAREALWHAIVLRNFGANHLIAAQEVPVKLAKETGVRILPLNDLVYLPDQDRYEKARSVPDGTATLSLSPSQMREDYLAAGQSLPEWFARPEVADVLARAYPPLQQQGFCIWFTGYPSAGKSTIADILAVLMMERGRQATLLDGDVVRTHLSKGLGFSRADRDTNILRIGFVASEIARHHGSVICAAVSPYRSTREQVRNMVGPERFIEVFVDTPLTICEQRDVKGFYARARAGELHGFTGVDDPYEPPASPEIVLTTTDCSPEESAHRIVRYLTERGFLAPQTFSTLRLQDGHEGHGTASGRN
jgi:sulfate adenylyltransferase